MTEIVARTRLKKTREAAGLSQERLARAVGITGNCLSRIERAVSNPSLKTALSISSVLDTSIEILFPELMPRKLRAQKND